MKVLFLGLGDAPARYHFTSIHCENYISRYMEGHEIFTFGYNKGVDIQIKPEDDFGEVIKQLPDGWMPDCCILWEADWNLLPKGIEKAPFPTVALPWDWDYDISLSRVITQSVDIVIAFADFEQECLNSFAGNAEIYYPIGMMREFHALQPKKMKDRKYDLVYTSTIDDNAHRDRSRLMIKLAGMAGKYKIRIRKNLPDFDDYIDLLRDAKMVLSHHRHGSMSGRIVEAGTQGTVVIETGREVMKHFEPDKEYIPVDENNLTERVERFLEDEEALQLMSDRVYRKCVQDFEARDQFVKFLDYLDRRIQGKSLRRRPDTLTESERANRNGESYYYSYFRCSSYFLMDTGYRLLELSMQEFERAGSLEHNPRYMTNLAIAHAVHAFLSDKDEVFHNKGISILRKFEEIILAFPTYVIAYFQLGIVHMQIGNNDEAMFYFKNATALIRSRQGYIDPWCIFNFSHTPSKILLRKPLNSILLNLCKGGGNDVLRSLEDLYQSLSLYFISILDELRGNINSSFNALLESRRLNPGSGEIAKRTAEISALLGYKDESLWEYEQAVDLLPLDVALRTNYMIQLYYRKKRPELYVQFMELSTVFSAIEGINVQTDDLSNLSIEFIKSYIKDAPLSMYQFDACVDKFLNSYAESLMAHFNKNANDSSLALRIAEVWGELGRVDKMVDIVDVYISNMSKLPVSIANKTVSRMLDMINVMRNKDKSSIENEFINFHIRIDQIKAMDRMPR